MRRRPPETGRDKAMSKAFASSGDLGPKRISFGEIGPGCYAFTAEGDPNSGVIVGDDGVVVIDAQATPAMAAQVIERVREVTDQRVRYVVLSHYHAVRVLGAAAYQAEQILASDATRALIVERGKEDWDSEYARFPRLFEAAETIPGLTWPTLVVGGGDPVKGEVPGKLSIDLGGVTVQIWHPGHGHTRGDTIAWVDRVALLDIGLILWRSCDIEGADHRRGDGLTVGRWLRLGGVLSAGGALGCSASVRNPGGWVAKLLKWRDRR